MKKVAIVYDWIDKWGGVERVLLTLHELFPQAIFYTSYYDKSRASWAKDINIKTSFIQKLPNIIKLSRIFSFPFYPYAFETFDFTGFDLVISVTSAFAKGIITKPGIKHICYLLTPTRYLWHMEDNYVQGSSRKFFGGPLLQKIREWDYVAAQRPNKIISISADVSQRCEKYYRRESDVIYPPFDMEYWGNIKYQISNIKNTNKNEKINIPQNYFLVVSRLESYKKVDLVINTFNQLRDQNLVIVGEGSKKGELQSRASLNTTFLGKISDTNLVDLYMRAEALIMPQEEDFGYVALEAQFFGCPVITYGKGGATETVIEGMTGLFFSEQSASALKDILASFHTISYNLKNTTHKLGREHLLKFGKEKFIQQFKSTIYADT